jgi:hypothetical protein
LNFSAGSAVPYKAELKELEKTKFCRMYSMRKILLNDAFRKTGNFPYKGLFYFRFRVRQFPFNPGYLTSFFSPKVTGPKNISVQEKFRLIKAGFTVYSENKDAFKYSPFCNQY